MWALSLILGQVSAPPPPEPPPNPGTAFLEGRLFSDVRSELPMDVKIGLVQLPTPAQPGFADLELRDCRYTVFLRYTFRGAIVRGGIPVTPDGRVLRDDAARACIAQIAPR